MAAVYSLIMGLLWLLAGLAAAMVILCLPPVYLRARVDGLHWDEETSLDGEQVGLEAGASALCGALQLLYRREGGRVRSEGRLLGITIPMNRFHGSLRSDDSRRAERPPEESRRPRKKEARKAAGMPVSWVALRRLLPDIQWLLSQARRRWRLGLRGELVYGCSDPFATAIVHRLLTAFPSQPGLALQPDYSGGTLKGWMEGSLRAYPWQILLLLVQAAFRPGVRALWWPRLRRALTTGPRRAREVAGT